MQKSAVPYQSTIGIETRAALVLVLPNGIQVEAYRLDIALYRKSLTINFWYSKDKINTRCLKYYRFIQKESIINKLK